MYDYYSDIVWWINGMLLIISVITSFAIFYCAQIKEFLWNKRREALLDIKKNVYEMVLAGEKSTEKVCYPITVNITPEQFIDIETNRKIDIAFFNENEREFLKKCFVTPQRVASLTKMAGRSRNKWRKIEAMLSLGYLKADEAVDVLELSLFSKDKDIVYFAIIALGQIKTMRAAKMLLDVMCKDPANSYKIVSILQDYPPEIVDEVFKLTDYHDPVIRYWAVTLLSKFNPAKYSKKLEKLTHDSSDQVRAAACACLGSMKQDETKDTIIMCLSDISWLVRRSAVLALSKVMKGKSISYVIGLINDASWSVVDAVKEAMIENIEASLPFIENFLAGGEEVPKKYSIYALQNSGYLNKILNEALSGTADSRSMNILKGVVRSKIHYGLDAAISGLDPVMRDKALEMLIKMQGT